MSDTGILPPSLQSHRQSGAAAVRVLIPMLLVALLALVSWLFLLRSYEHPVAEVLKRVKPPAAPAVSMLDQQSAESGSGDYVLTPEQLMTLKPAGSGIERLSSALTSPDQSLTPGGGVSGPQLAGTGIVNAGQSGDEVTSGSQAVVTANKARRPVPPLDKSDRVVRKELASLDATLLLADWLVDDELVRKFVVLIDNMAEGQIPRKHSILKPLSTRFRAAEDGERTYLDGYNFGRYTPYINLLASLDTVQVVGVYQRYYPLMQQAYAELGYPRRSFHRRLVRAVDHLLDSPVLEGAIELKRPSVMFQYADPQLEQLSAVHKQLLRTGPENTRKIMTRLSVLRSALMRLEHG